MGILKIEYGIKDWRRINLPRRVVEAYFFVIHEKQARQNITKSVLEDNLVYSGIRNVKPKLPISAFTKFYCLLCLSEKRGERTVSLKIFFGINFVSYGGAKAYRAIFLLYRCVFLTITNDICLYKTTFAGVDTSF